VDCRAAEVEEGERDEGAAPAEPRGTDARTHSPPTHPVINHFQGWQEEIEGYLQHAQDYLAS
jgi:hypothetical protein